MKVPKTRKAQRAQQKNRVVAQAAQDKHYMESIEHIFIRNSGIALNAATVHARLERTGYSLTLGKTKTLLGKMVDDKIIQHAKARVEGEVGYEWVQR